MSLSTDKQEALIRIEALVREHALEPEQVAEYLARGANARPASARLATRIFAYLGAVFILAGVVAALQLLWPQLSALARVVSSFGSGLIALVLAVVAQNDRRAKSAATPLFLIAALLQTVGLFVCLDEFWPTLDSEPGAIVVFAALAAQSAFLLAAYRRTSLLFLWLLFATGAVAAGLAWAEVDEGLTAFLIGVSGLALAWKIDATEYRAIAPLAWTGYAFSLGVGAFELLESRFPYDFLLIGLAALLIHLGAQVRSRALLVAAVISMLGYLGYFTGEYFADLLSWPIALVGLGITMLLVSAYAVRLGGRIQRISD